MSLPERKFVPPPDGWGNDALSRFQAASIQNEYATFVAAPAWYKALSDIADDLQKCSSYAISIALKTDDPSAQLLFTTSCNQYLAAASLATACHCLGAYPTGRAVMESALYGWYIARTPEAGKRWHNKPTKREEARKWGAEFSFGRLATALAEVAPDTGEWARYLHQTAIDFGAHPNKSALYSNMSFEEREDGTARIGMTVLHQLSDLVLTTLKFVIETGLFAITLFAATFPEAEKKYSLWVATTNHKVTLSNLVAASAEYFKQQEA